ncbi:MAG: type II secretion system protein [Lachnospiraceae bacterium]|nr:type II secretion system protein [Lachnospiraceae bacterium]
MKRLKKLRENRKAGVTLVEMVVTLLLFGIMMAFIIGILSPAAKMFVRMQKLQYAQIIVDNTIQELRGLAQEATGYVKIYEKATQAGDEVAGNAEILNKPGKDRGQALEFITTQNYLLVISTGGCEETDIYLRTDDDDSLQAEEGITPGRLLGRYYSQDKQNRYVCQKDGTPVARAVAGIFTDGYYMGNYLEITFSYPPKSDGTTPQVGDPVEYLLAEVCLYSDAARTQLVTRDTAVIDFRYEVKRNDALTVTDIYTAGS